MSLEFLSPRAAAPTPPRSPLLDAAIAAGASATVLDGWEVVESFGDTSAEAAACRESVGYADLSQIGKLELQTPVGERRAEFRAGIAVYDQDCWHCPVRPRRQLVLCSPGAIAELRDRAGAEARVVDLTASLAALTIAGPLARETFAQFCALDLRDGSLPVAGFLPGSVARTPGFVLREGSERFLFLFGAAYAQYVWETVAAAVERLGGRPVGAAALPAPSPEVQNA